MDLGLNEVSLDVSEEPADVVVGTGHRKKQRAVRGLKTALPQRAPAAADSEQCGYDVEGGWLGRDEGSSGAHAAADVGAAHGGSAAPGGGTGSVQCWMELITGCVSDVAE